MASAALRARHLVRREPNDQPEIHGKRNQRRFRRRDKSKSGIRESGPPRHGESTRLDAQSTTIASRPDIPTGLVASPSRWTGQRPPRIQLSNQRSRASNLPPSGDPVTSCAPSNTRGRQRECGGDRCGDQGIPPLDRNPTKLLKSLERAKGFEPSTPTLARLCSTPELRPLWRTGQSLPVGWSGQLASPPDARKPLADACRRACRPRSRGPYDGDEEE